MIERKEGNECPHQHSTDTKGLATRSTKNENDTTADPEYNPMSAPFGTLAVGRTPHPQFGVLNTSSGHLRGFCATRVGHVSSQEQFCTMDENNVASLIPDLLHCIP